MSLSDNFIRIVLIAIILLYITVWIAGIRTGKMAGWLASLNAVSGLVIIGYWAVRQGQITQHSFEAREMIALFFEVVVVVVSLHHRTGQGNSLMNVFVYAFFGLHLTAMLLFLLYMTAFKINRLI